MYGRETETDKKKRKTFLDSLKRYKAIGRFSGKDFDAEKIVQYSKQRKEMPK